MSGGETFATVCLSRRDSNLHGRGGETLISDYRRRMAWSWSFIAAVTDSRMSLLCRCSWLPTATGHMIDTSLPQVFGREENTSRLT